MPPAASRRPGHEERMPSKSRLLALLLIGCSAIANAETPDEWITLGARVHGAFGAFIPVGIKIGLDAMAVSRPSPAN
jgi:hypothetical protein